MSIKFIINIKVKLKEFLQVINVGLNSRKQKPLIHYKTPDTFIYYPELAI